MGTGNSIPLARIFGIRIGATYSWFFALFLIIWGLSGYFQDVLLGSSTQAYITAVLAGALFFVSILLHELGHALAARRDGIGITGIDLWFFGGVAKMDRDSRTPGEEFRVAAAGPLVTVGIVLLCGLIGTLASESNAFVNAATLTIDSTTPALALLGWLAAINVFVLVFNIIPAFPLDGGRIARAIAWKVSGDRNKATRLSGRLGQGFGYLLIGVGIYLVLRDQPIDGIWLGVLGLFLAQAAGGAVASSLVSAQIDGVTAADVMEADPISVPEDTAVRDADDWFFHRYQAPWFPVVDNAGHYIGVLMRERVDTAVRAGHPLLPVREVLDVSDGHRSCVSPEETLEELLASDSLRRLGALIVLDHDGVIRGVVTTDRVRRALGDALGGGTATV